MNFVVYACLITVCCLVYLEVYACEMVCILKNFVVYACLMMVGALVYLEVYVSKFFQGYACSMVCDLGYFVRYPSENMD